MATIRYYQIFENVNYLEDISQKDDKNPRFTFFVKNLDILQEIEDILNSVEESVFENNYVLDFYKSTTNNDKINYYSRSGRVHYAKDIIVELDIGNSKINQFEKSLLNNLFSNVHYEEGNSKPTVILKNSTVIYLTQLEFLYIQEYYRNKQTDEKLIECYSCLPLFSWSYNMHDFLKLKNCVYLWINDAK
jgi:hypothetical protein